MSLGLGLFANRHACLIVLILEIAVLPIKGVVVALILLLEVQRTLASLVHEILRQLQVLRVTGDSIETHQGHLYHRVSRIAV